MARCVYLARRVIYTAGRWAPRAMIGTGLCPCSRPRVYPARQLVGGGVVRWRGGVAFWAPVARRRPHRAGLGHSWLSATLLLPALPARASAGVAQPRTALRQPARAYTQASAGFSVLFGYRLYSCFCGFGAEANYRSSFLFFFFFFETPITINDKNKT